MAGPPSLPVGQRIRHYRRKNGNRSQAAVAGLCGISERYLQQIEAGQKMPSTEVLARLAHELGVPLAALVSSEPVNAAPSSACTTAPAVVHALLGHSPPGSAGPADPVVLRERVEQAWRIWQSSRQRFTQAADLLPDLMTDVEQARRTDSATDDAGVRREVLRIAADLYGLLRSYCRRTGRLDLSLMVADRGSALLRTPMIRCGWRPRGGTLDTSCSPIGT
jgi:transcriptional regulator with XRE-family HTH domain